MEFNKVVQYDGDPLLSRVRDFNVVSLYIGYGIKVILFAGHGLHWTSFPVV